MEHFKAKQKFHLQFIYINLETQILMNNLIDSKFINQDFITLYREVFELSPMKSLQQIKKALNTKTSPETKKNIIIEFSNKANHILSKLNRQTFNFDQLVDSTRNTEFNILVTELFLFDPFHRRVFQETRIKALDDLKQQNLDQSDFNSLYSIYKKLYFGNQSLSWERLYSEEGKKTFKTILTSLKKMVVMKTKKSKKTKAVTTQPYYVNIDTRIILEVCLKRAQCQMQKALVLKIETILQEKKKWVGPRIWKIVQQNEWSIYQIEMFIKLIEEVYGSLTNFKSEPKELKKHIQKILMNLRILLKQCLTPCETEDVLESEMKQLYYRFEQIEKYNGFSFEFKNMEELEVQFLQERQPQSEILCEQLNTQPFWL